MANESTGGRSMSILHICVEYRVTISAFKVWFLEGNVRTLKLNHTEVSNATFHYLSFLPVFHRLSGG